MSDSRRNVVVCLLLGASLAGAGLVAAQVAPAPARPPYGGRAPVPPVAPPAAAPAAAPGGEDVAEGVFVRDSTAAVDRFALAARLESLKEWTKAADVYQQIVEQDGDRLIADRAGDDGKVYQYASVARATQRKLAAWPAEGREVYQQKFGGAAQALLDQADAGERPDAEVLQQIVRLYFVTDAAKVAALKLADLHLVAGRFSAAKRLVDELLDHHPALGDGRADVLLRGVVAAHFLGDDAAAKTYTAALKADFPDATGTVAGEPQKLADAADAVLSAAPPPDGETAAGRWPTFAGAPGRDRSAAPLTSPIAPYLRGIEMPDERVSRNAGVRRTQDLEYDRGRKLGQMTGVFPVAYDGALYWSDNVRVYAIGLESGLPLPGWLASHGEEGLAAYALPGGGFPTPRGVANLPSVTDRCVLALLGTRDQRLYQNSGRPAMGEPQLVCLDRLTGRPLWNAKPADLDAALLGDDALRGDFAATRFTGAPLIVGGDVWILAQSDPQRGEQFEQSFLVGLDLATGHARTLTYLASATRDFDPRYGDASLLPEPASPLAYADGLVYAPTDGGVLAAVRASDGATEWLNLYPRLVSDPRLARARRSRIRVGETPARPFLVSPPVVNNGRVFFRPPDATQAFVYDAADGREIARVDLDSLKKQGADRSLLTVRGDEMILYGAQGVAAIDWAAVRDGTAAGRAVRWVCDVPPPPGRDDSILGRPAVTANRVIVPGADKLYLIDLASQGKIDANYPADGGTWADDEEPGNVVVVEDQVVVAGATKLNVYADSRAVRGRLAKQLADDPSDPTPMLRLAQVAFVGGDFDDTIARLRQAEQAAGALRQQERARAGQAEAFASALGFARTLRGRLDRPRAAGNPTPATVERFFDLAESFARTARQNVELRFKRAEFAAGEGGGRRRATLLQEILADAAWRRVPVLPADGADAAPRPAGEVARRLLDELVRSQGPGVYAEIEARAAEDLAAADGDAAALRRVADVYPNSAAAPAALAEAARLLRESDRPAEATAVLRRMAGDRALGANGDERAAIDDWLQIAQLDANRPERFAVAAGRLRKAARLAPDRPAPAIAYGDGRSTAGLTLRQAADALTEAQLARETAALPSFDLPPEPDRAPFADAPAEVDGVAALLVPGDSFDRPGRVVARGGDGRVSVYAFGQSRPLWAAPADAASAQGAAWLPEGLLVWGTGGAAMYEADTGKLRWKRLAADLAQARLAGPAAGNGGNDAAVVVGGWSSAPAAAAAAAPQRADNPYGDLDPDDPRADLRLRQLLAQQAMQQGAGVQVQIRGQPLQPFQARGQVQARPQPADNEVAAPAAPAGPVVAAVVPRAGTLAVVVGDAKDDNAVVGLDAATGEVAWRGPLPDGTVGATAAGGDYLAVETDDGGSATLSALDFDTGRLAARRAFGPDDEGQLANFLVSPENELIFCTPAAVTAVDLDGEADGARFVLAAAGAGEDPLSFAAAAGPGRMRVVGRELLVYADPAAAGRQDVLVVSLATGRPVQVPVAAAAADADAVKDIGDPANFAGDANAGEAVTTVPLLLLGGGDDDPAVARVRFNVRPNLRPRGEPAPDDEAARLFAAGPSVYLMARRGLTAYDRTLPGRQWYRLNSVGMRLNDPATNLDLALGRDDLLLFDRPRESAAGGEAAGGEAAGDGRLRLTAFSRQRIDRGVESGVQRHEIEFVDAAATPEKPDARGGRRRRGTRTLDVGGRPVAWQATAGGVALLTDAGRLLFLHGAAGE